jgi:hypothetical protein
MNWLSIIVVASAFANVTIYENYGGYSPFTLKFAEGEYPNDPYPTNKLMSSISVPSGFFVKLYDEPDFRGTKWNITGPSNVYWATRFHSMKVTEIKTKNTNVFTNYTYLDYFFLICSFLV